MSPDAIDCGPGTKHIRSTRAIRDLAVLRKGSYKRDQLTLSPGAHTMRYRIIALTLLVFSMFSASAPMRAEDAKSDVKGIFLLTDYPAISVRPGTTATIGMRLQNYNMPPERLQIAVDGVPKDWTLTVIGGGQPIEAVLPATNASVSFE